MRSQRPLTTRATAAKGYDGNIFRKSKTYNNVEQCIYGATKTKIDLACKIHIDIRSNSSHSLSQPQENVQTHCGDIYILRTRYRSSLRDISIYPRPMRHQFGKARSPISTTLHPRMVPQDRIQHLKSSRSIAPTTPRTHVAILAVPMI